MCHAVIWQTCSLQALIRDMKAKLEELSETPANLQRLVFRGHMLKDEQTLSHHSTLSPAVPCKQCYAAPSFSFRFLLVSVECQHMLIVATRMLKVLLQWGGLPLCHFGNIYLSPAFGASSV